MRHGSEIAGVEAVRDVVGDEPDLAGVYGVDTIGVMRKGTMALVLKHGFGIGNGMAVHACARCAQCNAIIRKRGYRF